MLRHFINKTEEVKQKANQLHSKLRLNICKSFFHQSILGTELSRLYSLFEFYFIFAQ